MAQPCPTVLDAISLDRASPVPLYHQIFLEIQRLIETGSVAPGDVLSRSQDLCRMLQVSTTTANRAIAELKRHGLVHTCRGRGTFVSQGVVPTTELVMALGDEQHTVRQTQFLHLLLSGLRRGFTGSQRRCVLTAYDVEGPSSAEIQTLVRLRHADSLAFYRPNESTLRALRAARLNCAVVGVLGDLDGGTGDSVLSAPEPPLRRFLEERFRAGSRIFVYAGSLSLHRNQAISPYAEMHRVFMECAAGFAVEPIVHLVDDTQPAGQPALSVPEREDLIAERMGVLASGSLVVADTPRLASKIRKRNPAADLVSYTESPDALARYGGEMTLLYLGLDIVGEAAARVLRQRLGAPTCPRQVEMLVPALIAPGNSR